MVRMVRTQKGGGRSRHIFGNRWLFSSSKVLDSFHLTTPREVTPTRNLPIYFQNNDKHPSQPSGISTTHGSPSMMALFPPPSLSSSRLLSNNFIQPIPSRICISHPSWFLIPSNFTRINITSLIKLRMSTTLQTRGIRWLTTDTKGNNDKNNNSKDNSNTETTTIKEGESQTESVTKDRTSSQDSTLGEIGRKELPALGEESLTGSGSSTSTTNNSEKQSGRVAAIVDSVGPTLRRVANEWDTNDLLSVYGILTLITIIVVAPMVVRHMRRSETKYDEDLDPEDPVADLAKIVRDEYSGKSPEEITHSPLALDSILSDLLKSKQFQQAVSSLVTQVVQSPEFKRACQVLLKELWNDLITDPETTKQVIHLLYNAIQDEQIKEAAIQLVIEVVNDKEVLDELVLLLQRIGNEEKVGGRWR